MTRLAGIVGDVPDSGNSEAEIAHVFTFDAASPATYVAAQDVELECGDAICLPALDPRSGLLWSEREETEAAAAEAGLRLIWPDRQPDARRVNRAAIHARDRGRGLQFVLAAARLAFGGGFDLDDDRTLAHAARAAGLEEGGVLAAAADSRYDLELTATGRRAAELGLVLPALEGPDASAVSTASRAERKHASIETPRR